MSKGFGTWPSILLAVSSITYTFKLLLLVKDVLIIFLINKQMLISLHSMLHENYEDFHTLRMRIQNKFDAFI